MSLLDSIGGLIQQYAAGAAPSGDVNEHYQQISQAVPSSSIAAGLAAALGSGGATNFGQMASQLFNNSGGAQQANMLNELLATAGPALTQFLGANAGSTLSGMLASGQTQLTPQQAAGVPAEEVQALAQHVHSVAPGVVDRVSQIYAEHPQLVQTLGAAAMALAIRKIAERHAS